MNFNVYAKKGPQSTMLAVSSEKVPLNIHRMCSFRSSYACTKSHPGLGSPLIYFIVSNGSISRRGRP